MFGLFKKSIPGPDAERHELIRRMIRYRLGDDDPICAELENMPIPMLKLTAEAGILFIVEQFLTIFLGDATEELVVNTLNEVHASTFELAGDYLPLMQHPATLLQYVRHYIDARFPDSGPYTDAFVADAIQMVKTYYRR